MKMKSLFCFARYATLVAVLSVMSIVASSGQDARLAAQYMRNGEYEKAAKTYKKLYEKNRANVTLFSNYISALGEYEAYEEAQAALKFEVKRRPKDVDLLVLYGDLYEKQFKSDEADQQYRKAIANVTASPAKIIQLSDAFTRIAKYDLAIEVLEKGNELVDGTYDFSTRLASLYYRKGNMQKMVFYYLEGIETYSKRITSLQSILQRNLPAEDYDYLQEQLYERIQSTPDQELYTEMLAWTFIHRKQYDKALRQARAMDRRLQENGGRVFDVAKIADNAGDFATALKGYDYITTYHGPNTSYYLDAKLGYLHARRKQITSKYDYTTADLDTLAGDYQAFLDEFGKNTETAPLIKQLAYLQAYYLDDVQGGITLLEEVKNFGGLQKHEIADTKLELGDLYLVSGDIWESSLLYSQVDKAYKEGQLGEQARYRNARLSYFNGDFEWAQQQFDILKSATTRLISNDAIDMSVFITDNLGLDTTDVPLKMYADSELLLFQNKYDESLIRLEEIEESFPEHSLTDDILYSRAQIYRKRRDYEQAVSMYEKIIADHVEEIRCDNALFELAELYRNELGDNEKAMQYYKQLFVDFSNSTLAKEARKQFRVLRGDEIG